MIPIEKMKDSASIDFEAVITCPKCQFAKHEQMPPDT